MPSNTPDAIKATDAMNSHNAAATLYTKPKRIDPLLQKWEMLPANDKAALITLILFLIIVGGGYGGYKVHIAASEQQQTYQNAVNDYFWLRAQAGNINPAQDNKQAVAIDQQLNQILAQFGATELQVLQVGDAVQISFTAPNQAVASNILSAITSRGFYLQQLSMQQNPDNQALQVQATVTLARV